MSIVHCDKIELALGVEAEKMGKIVKCVGWWRRRH